MINVAIVVAFLLVAVVMYFVGFAQAEKKYKIPLARIYDIISYDDIEEDQKLVETFEILNTVEWD